MIGRTYGNYRILQKLGEGAVGVVYKAEHVRLKHQVVLKFLRPEFATNEVKRTRFLREAEIAASLDSQSICSVIDYGEEAADSLYLVMRYCEGEDLQSRLTRGPLSLPTLLLFAIQVAEGLQAAHSHDIVHRDIKPSNIIIGSHPVSPPPPPVPIGSDEATTTTDMPELIEQAKITDFGLALLSEGQRLTLEQTRMGTPAFMSPEQVGGEPVDHRTDIWSLGGVIYNMTTGVPPFGTDSAQAIMYSVQHSDPTPVTNLRPEAPPELDWIINKALRKEPGARYQSAEAILHDLRLLREKLTGGRRRDLGSWIIETRGRMLTLGSGLLAVALALLVSNFAVPGFKPNGIAQGHPRQITTSLTWDSAPAVSPDGSRIAYASDETGDLEIYLVPRRGGPGLRLTDNPANDTYPTWYPDGSALLFASDRLDMQGVWKVGTLGGTPTLVISAANDPAISPDGTQLAFCRVGTEGEFRIFVAPLTEPDNARQLSFDDNGTFSHGQPAWSPDGQTLCYTTAHDLWTVPVVGGPPQALTSGGNADSSPNWSTDGKHIYFSSVREHTTALWRVAANGGEPERLTLGSGPETDPSLAANGSVLAYTTGGDIFNDDIMIISTDNGTHRRLFGLDDACHPALSNDGQMLCFVSNRQEGIRDLWLQNMRHGHPDGDAWRFTDQPGSAAHPCFSPDGRWVAYYRILDGTRRIWIAPTDGGQAWPFTADEGENILPSWAPDGRHLAFICNRDSVSSVFVAPVREGQCTGEPELLSPPGVPCGKPSWSPDGCQIAFNGTFDNRDAICLIAADGSQEMRILDLAVAPHMVLWNQASGRLWVSGLWDGALGIRVVDPVTGTVQDLPQPIRFENDLSLAYFHTDALGDQVVYSRPTRQGNIWILEADGSLF